MKISHFFSHPIVFFHHHSGCLICFFLCTRLSMCDAKTYITKNKRFGNPKNFLVIKTEEKDNRKRHSKLLNNSVSCLLLSLLLRFLCWLFAWKFIPTHAMLSVLLAKTEVNRILKWLNGLRRIRRIEKLLRLKENNIFMWISKTCWLFWGFKVWNLHVFSNFI